MILAIVAVGDSYIEKCLPYLNKFKNNGYQIKILTDNPSCFIGYDTQLYENKIFSYFDKLIFSFRLIEKYKKDVLYIDADWLRNINDDFMKEFIGGNNVFYYDTWKNYFSPKNWYDDVYWRDLFLYFHLNNIDYKDFELPIERILYFPNINNITEVLLDIEKIKPVFDWIGTINQSNYSGIGGGEGIGLSYVLNKHNIQLTKFNKRFFNNLKYI
jgi:hypothetical protein